MISSQDAELRAHSQRLMLEAGYEPQDNWIYIDDLLKNFQARHVAHQKILQEIDLRLDGLGAITRAAFKRLTREVVSQFRAQQTRERQQLRTAEIYAQAGIVDPGPGHEALALRIAELEGAVKSYATQLRAAEAAKAAASQRKCSSFTPFLVGVMIRGIVF